MNKKLIALALMLVFILTVFGACSDKADESTGEATSAEETVISEVAGETQTEEATEEQKTTEKETSAAEETTKKTKKKGKTEETTEAETKKSEEKTSEKATEKAEDTILVTYSEETDDGEYKISLVLTSKGDYVLETAQGTCTADEGAYKGCLNSFYAFDMGAGDDADGSRQIHILLEDGKYTDVCDSNGAISDGFVSIRNILTSFDENAPAANIPEDAAG